MLKAAARQPVARLAAKREDSFIRTWKHKQLNMFDYTINEE